MDHENQDIPQSGQGNGPREVVLRYEAPVTPIVERYIQPTPLPGQPKKHTSPRKKRKGLKIFLSTTMPCGTTPKTLCARC